MKSIFSKLQLQQASSFAFRNHVARFACLSCFILLFGSNLAAQILGNTASKQALAYLNEVRANPAGHSGDGKFTKGDGNLDWYTAIRVNLQGVAPRSPLYWHDDLFKLCEAKANALAEFSIARGEPKVGHTFNSSEVNPTSLPQWQKDYLTNGILKFAGNFNYKVPLAWQNDYFGENVASYAGGGLVLGENPSEEVVAKAFIRQLINDYNYAHSEPGAGHRRALLGMNKGYRDPIHFAMAIRKFTINKPGWNNHPIYIGVAMVIRPSNTLRVENFDLISTATTQPDLWLMTEWTGDQLNKGPNGKYEQCMSTKEQLQPNASGGNLFEFTDRWNNDRHKWTLQKAGNGYYQLVIGADLKCLALDSNGAGVLKAKDSNDASQLWSFEHVDETSERPSHRYFIVNKSNGEVLTNYFNGGPKNMQTGKFWDIYCDNPVMNGPLTN